MLMVTIGRQLHNNEDCSKPLRLVSPIDSVPRQTSVVANGGAGGEGARCLDCDASGRTVDIEGA